MSGVHEGDVVIVYYLKKEWRGTKDPPVSYGKVYHYRKDCPALKNSHAEPRETTEEEAQERWLELCGRCGNRTPKTRPVHDKYDDDLLNELSDSE